MGCPTDNEAEDANNNGHSEWNPRTFVGRLKPAERQALFTLGGLALHPAGGHLLAEGDRSRFVLVLRSGPVKVVVHDTSGREHLLALRGRGDILGELSYLDNQPRSASVVALRAVYVTKIGPEPFKRFLEEYSGVGIELSRCVGERLREADRSRLELSTDDVALRVTRLLHNLTHGQLAGSTRWRAVVPLTQGQLAQLAHASEVAVQRVLRELRERDIIHTAYRSIEVPCAICLDLLLENLSVERKDRREVHGCNGRESHRSR
jgi:CRP/FNR family transcriptional regulator, cyclic AMP receptor protein